MENNNLGNIKTNANIFGEFVPETRCNCGFDDKILITKAQKKSCLMINYASHILINNFSNLISARVEHDYLKCEYKCLICHQQGNIIVEFSSDGVEHRFGDYRSLLSRLSKSKNYRYFSFDQLKNNVNKIERVKNYSGANYNLLKKNCQDFANDLWEYIKLKI